MVLLAGLLALLTACGGGPGATLPLPHVPDPTGPADAAQAAALAALPPLLTLDVLDQPGDDLTALRGASGIRPAGFHAVYAAELSAAAHLDDTGYGVVLPGTADRAEYAIYAVSSLDNPVQLHDVQPTLTAGGADPYVAFADFVHNRWSPLTRGADGSYAPSGGRTAPCVSSAGRAFVAVIATSAATLRFITLNFDDGGQLPAPQGLTAAPRATGLHASWQPYNDPRRGSIHVTVTGPSYSHAATLGRDETQFDLDGLTPGAQYTVLVQAASSDAQPQLGRSSQQSVTLPVGWDHTWASGQRAAYVGLLPLSDGSLLAAGNSNVSPASGGIVQHFDVNGSLLSSRLWQGAGFSGIAPAPSGSCVFGTVNTATPGVTQALVLRLAADGTTQWARGWSAAATAYNAVTAAVCDPAGDVYAAVVAADQYNVPYANYVIKFSPAGDVVWAHEWTSTTYTQLTSLALADDGVYAGGWQYSADPGPSLTSNGPQQLGLLFKVSAAGDFSWARQWQGQNQDGVWLSGLVPASDGGCFAAGVIQDDPNQILYIGGPKFSRGLVARVGADGTPAWLRAYNDFGVSDSAFDFVQFDQLAADGAGGCYTLGYQSGSTHPAGQLVCAWDGQGVLGLAQCETTTTGTFSAVAAAPGRLLVAGQATAVSGGWTAAGGTSETAVLNILTPANALAAATGSATNLDAQEAGRNYAGTLDPAATPPGDTSLAWIVSQPQ